MKSQGLAVLTAFLSILTTTVASAADDSRHWDIKAMQKQIENQNLSFTVKPNWVTDFLARGGRMTSVTGLVKTAGVNELANSRYLKPRSDLPDHFDWRQEVPGGLQPIRNQGTCGSCWAFSVTAVLESLIMIDRPQSSVDLAEQTLVSSCSNSGNCNGGYFSAFNFLKTLGLGDEASDPYRAKNSSCRSGISATAKIKEWSYIRGANGGSPTTAQIKTAIQTYGPISVTVNASFSGYSTGIFDNCNRRSVDHMVTLEGWDDVGKFWIMRNSWGTGWGENGYMKIKYTDRNGYKCNNIGSTAAYAVLDKSSRP